MPVVSTPGLRAGRAIIVLMVALAGLAAACAPSVESTTSPADLLADGLARLEMARVTRLDADYLEAQRLLESAHAADPSDANAAIALATARASQHRFAEAIVLATTVLASDPDRPDALAVRGDALLATGDGAGAAADHRRLHEVDPGPASLVRLAHGLEESGDPWSARDLARRALAEQRLLEAASGGPQGETAAWYRWRVGDLERHLGAADAAEPLFAEALAIEPGYGLAQLGLIDVAVQRGDLDVADRRLQQWDGAALLRLEAVLLVAEAAGDHSTVETTRQEIIARLTERNPVAAGLDLAATLLDADARHDEAVALTTDELTRRRDAATLATHARALLAVGRVDEAVPVVDEFLATGTNEPDRLAVAAAVFDATGDTVRADEARKRAEAVTDA